MSDLRFKWRFPPFCSNVRDRIKQTIGFNLFRTTVNHLPKGNFSVTIIHSMCYIKFMTTFITFIFYHD